MDLSTYLEGLLHKPSIPESELAHFLKEMRKTPSGPLITSKILAAKIQSPSEAQALRAFDILESALGLEVDGSIELRTEIGRFRFLNELIRILSPKFHGSQTIPAVKERAIQFLTEAAGSRRRQWFPSEHSKIEAVYNSLVEGGIILANAVDPDAEFQKNIFERGENAILLRKLLQSKDPSDLQAANRLIKNLVDEEAKRNERRSEIHSLIDRIETSTTLLTEMCNQATIDREIVDDLASSCRSLRNRLGEIGTETNEETSSLLQASDNIEKALSYYEERKNQVNLVVPKGTEDLIGHPSLSPEVQKPAPAGMSLADELLHGMDLGPSERQTSSKDHGAYNTVSSVVKTKEVAATDLLNLDIDLGVTNCQPKDTTKIKVSEDKKSGGLDELGFMSRQLMQQSLGGRDVCRAFEVEMRSDKVTLNQLQKQTVTPNQNQVTPLSDLSAPAVVPFSPSSHISLIDLDFLEKSSSTKLPIPTNNKDPPAEDETILLVLGKDSEVNGASTQLDQLSSKRDESGGSDIDSNFSFDGIMDVDLENIELLEDLTPFTIPLNSVSKLDISFTFGTFPGIPSSVKVTVITVTNRNPVSPLSDYRFQLLPPKGFQVKLFPPSSTDLSPWRKRFLGPPLLTQIVLIRVPQWKNSKDVNLKFILSCYLGDEIALFNSEFTLPSF